MKKMQLGRSMVEMLGVLAIIGVLSIGSIAGYSKAMYNHRLNLFMSGIEQIMYSSDIYLKGQALASDEVIKVFTKLNLIPEGFRVIDKYNLSFTAFNNNIKLSAYSKYIRLTITQNPPELCKTFFLNAKDWADENMLWMGVIRRPDQEPTWTENAVYYVTKKINHFNNIEKIASLCDEYNHESAGMMIERYHNK